MMEKTIQFPTAAPHFAFISPALKFLFTKNLNNADKVAARRIEFITSHKKFHLLNFFSEINLGNVNKKYYLSMQLKVIFT